MLTSPVVVVLEGEAKRGVPEGTADGVEVVHAPGQGDDTLAALASDTGHDALLVSSDRRLGERVRRTGADVVGARWLLDQLAP